MKYSDFYEARSIITQILQQDLLGPVKEDEIICGERPLEYYILGKLYPRNCGVRLEDRSPSEDVGEMDAESTISLANSFNPSSFGLSFSVNTGVDSFSVHVEAAKYILITAEEAAEKLDRAPSEMDTKIKYWKRAPLDFTDIEIRMSDLSDGKLQFE